MLETPRLIIRQWEDKDREPFAALNADPDVMRFFRLHYRRLKVICSQIDLVMASKRAVGAFGPLS